MRLVFALACAFAAYLQDLVDDLRQMQRVGVRVEVLLLDKRELTECLKDYQDFVEDFAVDEGPITVYYHFLKRSNFSDDWWHRALAAEDEGIEELPHLPWHDHVFTQVVWVSDEGPCFDKWGDTSPVLYADAVSVAVSLKRNCPFPQFYFHKWFMERLVHREWDTLHALSRRYHALVLDTVDFCAGWSDVHELINVLFYNYEHEFATKWAEHIGKLEYTRVSIQTRKYSEAEKLLGYLERSTSLKRWITKHLRTDDWREADLNLIYMGVMVGVLGWVTWKALELYRFKHLPQV